MADIVIAANRVVAGAGAYVKHGTPAGENITQGQAVYLSAAGKWMLANAESSVAGEAEGIALNASALDQPLSVQMRGTVKLTAPLTPGLAYYLSENPGGICGYTDLDETDYLCLIGFAINTAALQLSIDFSGTLVGGGVPDAVAPTITSSASTNVAEEAVLAHGLTASESVTWSIRTSGQNAASVDYAHFELSGSTLRWLSNGTKDYETPDDTGTNNTYVVVVRATDGSSNTADQTITVTVTNVAEGSSFNAAYVPVLVL